MLQKEASMPCGTLNHPVFAPDELSRLTPRERELLGCFAQGLSNKVVAIDFGISLRTAEAHRARIFRKLGVRTAMELACTLCPHRAGGDAAH
jgi:DNA-binding NarL/FixJ family response regulator